MKHSFTLLTAALTLPALAQTAESDSLRLHNLEEVVVSAEKPQIKSGDGIISVDLPTIVRDKPVSNILEALSFLPGVVDNDGMIGLAGAGSATILLNGEPTEMPASNMYQLLYSTPIDRLKNVEIMYSAPAKYHVDGAVINIILKTPTPLDGLQGQIRASYNQAHYGSYGGALAATYAITKWSFDLNYSLTRSRTWGHENTLSNHLLHDTRTVITDDSRRTGRSLPNIIYASAGYKISDRSNLRLTYNGQISTRQSGQSLSSGSLGDFSNDYSYITPSGFHNISLRYTSPKGLIAGADYTSYSEHRSQTLSAGQQTSPLSISANRQDINRYHVYIDHTHDIRGWQLDYGAEYQHTDDRSFQQHTLPKQTGFAGTLSEDIAGAYIGTGHTFPWGLSFNTSAKIEYYGNGEEHRWNFIPQLGATYHKTPASIFQLNLTSQRIFPSYWELHSGTSYINDYSIILGNPELKPHMDYSGQLSYIFRQKYVATLYLQYADLYSAQLPYQSPDEMRLIYQTLNMDYKRVAGLNLHIPIETGSVLSATATANAFHQREKSDRFHHIEFDNRKWIFYGSLNNTVRFAAGCPVSLSVDLSYISPSLQGIADLSAMWRIDAGLKWSFAKGRTCELNIRYLDMFNTWSPVMTISHAGQDYRMKVHDMTRSLRFTFIWRFNGFKPKDTTIDTSRFGTGSRQ